MEKQTKKYHSSDELVVAIENLTFAQKKKLGIISQLYAQKVPDSTWEDLFNESMYRCVRGTRNWPVDVDIVKYLKEVIRSVASEEYEKQKERKNANVYHAREVDKTTLEAGQASCIDDQNSAETREREEEVLKLMDKMFESDELTFMVFASKQDGMSASRIQDEFNIDRKKYESICKKISRKISKFNQKEIANAK